MTYPVLLLIIDDSSDTQTQYCTVGRCLVTTSAFFAWIDNGLDGAPRRADRSGNGKIDNRQAPSIPRRCENMG